MSNANEIFARAPTYHEDHESAYLLPNDPVEQSRLVDQHNGLATLVEQLVHAPVDSPQTVLDIGCGTGIVTRYLSSRFPAAESVYGLDLSAVPFDPSDSDLPNLKFVRGNIRKLVGNDPRFRSETIDFAYSRLLLCGMTDWPGYVRDVFSVLKPGGWAQMGDYVEDVFYQDKHIIPRDAWDWLRLIREGGALQGLDLDAGLNVRKYMEDAGFVDIQRWEFPIPYWKIPGASSEIMTEHCIGDKWGLYWHMIPKLVEPLHLSEEKIEKLRQDMRRDLQEEVGKEQLFCVTIGRKPT